MTSKAEPTSSSSAASTPLPAPTTSSAAPGTSLPLSHRGGFPSTSFSYPAAAAPDIIRSHQKDAYFRGDLANRVAELHRRLWGTRSAHAWAAEGRLAADAAYLALTTLAGRRTLGEEYVDVVQVAAGESVVGGDGGRRTLPAGSIPTTRRRLLYVLLATVAPYLLGRALPGVRARMRRALERRLAAEEAALEQRRRRQQQKQDDAAPGFRPPPEQLAREARRARSLRLRVRVLRFVLAHLAALTDLATPLRAVSLALFYFGGAYYELPKRILGLRYIFTRRRDAAPGSVADDGAVGYEVLGVLLVVQMAVQGYLSARAAVDEVATDEEADREAEADAHAAARRAAAADRGPISSAGAQGDVSLSDKAYSANNSLLLPSAPGPFPGPPARPTPQTLEERLAATTHTPPAPLPSPTADPDKRARIDLSAGAQLRWMKTAQQRRCALCLDPLRDPAAPPCGHVFCWDCIEGWVREKSECPLCRREALAQHVLPLRSM